MTFQLDTSGAVRLVPAASDPDGPIYTWDRFDPFTQGYVGALFASNVYALSSMDKGPLKLAGFSDLAPATLGKILEDCASCMNAPGCSPMPDEPGHGAIFWELRQRSQLPAWPPLTVSLSDDGLVYLTEGVG